MCMYTQIMCTPNQRTVHDFHSRLYVRCTYVHVYIIYAYIFVYIYCIHTQPARSALLPTSTCVYMVYMYYMQRYMWIRLHSYKLHQRAVHCYHWHILYICIHISYFQWFTFLHYITNSTSALCSVPLALVRERYIWIHINNVQPPPVRGALLPTSTCACIVYIYMHVCIV